jgi:hypothetical protein
MATAQETEPTTTRRDRFRLAVGICLGVLVLAVAWSLTAFPSHYQKVQAAVGDDLRALLRKHPSVDTTAMQDVGLAVVYGAAGTVVLLSLLLRSGRLRRPDTRVFGIVAVAALPVAAVADVVENLLLAALVERVAGDQSLGAYDEAMRAAGTVKWTGIVLALVWTAWTVARPRPPEAPVAKGDPRKAPEWRREAWAPPKDGTERIGICCSGGGIRSAAFSLGVLQVLEKEKVLRKAEYLAAVSGGGYMAAGLEVANRTLPEDPPVPPPTDPLPYAPGSPEERHFRDNASYLVPSFFKALAGIGTLLAGLVFNLLVVWLVLFAVARPVGWAIGAIHPQLQFKEPIVLVDRAHVDVEVGSVTQLPNRADGAQVFEVALRTREGAAACFDVEPYGPGPGDHPVGVVTELPGVVEVKAGRAGIVRQPKVRAAPADRGAADCGGARLPDALLGLVEVEGKPTLKLAETGVGDPGTVASLLEVDDHAEVAPKVGLRGRDDITIEWQQWALGLGSFGTAVVVAFLKTVLGLRGRLRRGATKLQYALGAVGIPTFAVCVALPWLTQELTTWVGGLEEAGGGALAASDYFVPGGGIAILVASAVRRFLMTNQSRPGDAPRPQGGSLGQRAWRKLTGSSETLGWYELSPAKIVAAVAAALVPVFLFLYLLVYSAANGPGGNIPELAVVRNEVGTEWWGEEWKKFAMAVVVLLLLQRFVAAHNWSLHSFYKRRLSDAYLVHRRPDGSAAPVPFDDYPLRFHDGAADGFPQLILGCAVNLSEPGVVPPARRAASWTFSATEIGGPVVGYVRAEDYWNRLVEDRQKDITVPAAMAISGAAFSPAMGKFNLGPVGALYAFANLRLGVWLPHPQWVEANADSPWRDRPGWSWYLREIANRYKLDSPYLYVSDGGHWENLGLVELLRRGCTQVVCVNGGGDHQDSFGTIGEAVALAREELGVEIRLNPSPLRPPLEAQAAAMEITRELRRKGAKDRAEPMAVQSFAHGTFEYPNGRTGDIWLIEPALTVDMPLDVHVYAEGVAVFPDDSTADQVFNHEQFEAFHALGTHQATKVVADARTRSKLGLSP